MDVIYGTVDMILADRSFRLKAGDLVDIGDAISVAQDDGMFASLCSTDFVGKKPSVGDRVRIFRGKNYTAEVVQS